MGHPNPKSNSHSGKYNVDDEDDEYTKRIKRSGCFAQNENLLICYYDTKDWRKCRNLMKEFKLCMERNNPDAKK
ncbi:hypothetical protein HK098_003312 [Nowakowskiella sp. JEL0407]|nr:hypothetical protein HK098_003312 [Nowakowskiella sp. JEL0407]